MSKPAAPGTCLCLILAKKTSRRLPGKNKRLFGGRPLYARVLDAARDSGVFSRIACSSDDDEILAGLADWPDVHDVPRKAFLADDRASSWDVLKHFLATETALLQGVRDICLLTPCHPFRTAGHIRDAYRAFRQADAEALLAVTPYPYPPALAFDQNGGGFIRRQWHGLNRKDEHAAQFYPNGAIVFVQRDFFERTGHIYGERCLGYTIEWPYNLDIDDINDLHMAETLLPVLFDDTRENATCPA